MNPDQIDEWDVIAVYDNQRRSRDMVEDLHVDVRCGTSHHQLYRDPQQSSGFCIIEI